MCLWLTYSTIIILFQRGSTRNNFNKLSGNDGLTSTVVGKVKLVNHLTSVLGSVVHSSHTRRLLRSGTLAHSVEEGGTEGELLVALEDITLNLVLLQFLSVLDGLKREDGLLHGFVGNGGLELVENNVTRVIVKTAGDELVSDGSSLSIGGGLLADITNIKKDLVSIGTLQESTDLVTNAHKLGVDARLGGGKLVTDSLADGAVNGTAKTTVRGDKNHNLVRAGLIGLSLELGLLVQRGGSVTEDTGLLELTLSTGKLGSRHHLHGLGDLLDALHRGQADLDFFKGGHVTGLSGVHDGGSHSPHGLPPSYIEC
eukprot:Colp12_sorted_trinity150504_noHs@35989